MTRATLLPPAGLCLAVGLVFTGQGLGFIPGSFMTGSPFWAVVGVVLILIAVGLGILARRAAPTPRR